MLQTPNHIQSCIYVICMCGACVGEGGVGVGGGCVGVSGRVDGCVLQYFMLVRIFVH